MKKQILGTISVTALLMAFQNCAPAFKANSWSAQSSEVSTQNSDIEDVYVDNETAQAEIRYAANSGIYQRTYKMALYDNLNLSYGDLKMFTQDYEAQPDGQSIMILNSQASGFYANGRSAKDFEKILKDSIKKNAYDVNRLEIIQLTSPLYTQAGTLDSKGCPKSTDQIIAYNGLVNNVISAIGTVAPKAKVWYSFNKQEVDWQMNGCKNLSNLIPFHANYVSTTGLFVDFDSQMKKQNDWLLSHLQSDKYWIKKLILVPGVIFVMGSNQQSAVVGDLSKQIAYADQTNGNCKPGDTYQNTAHDYGCPIQAIVGYTAKPVNKYSGDAATYIGLLHKVAASIRTTWLNQLAQPFKK